jgi:heme-degrading monooxygenase HmoA
MVTELAILDLKPGGEAEFEAAFDRAKAIIASTEGFKWL